MLKLLRGMNKSKHRPLSRCSRVDIAVCLGLFHAHSNNGTHPFVAADLQQNKKQSPIRTRWRDRSISHQTVSCALCLCLDVLTALLRFAQDVQVAAATIKQHGASLAQLELEVQRWTDLNATLSSNASAGRFGPQAAGTSDAYTSEGVLGSGQLNAHLAVATEPCSPQALHKCRAACEFERKAHAHAQAAADAMPRAALSAERRAALHARRDGTITARARVALLEEAAEVLRGDIDQSKAAALRLNERVLARAAAAFRATMATALPDFTFVAEAAATGAADGVHVRYRKANASAAASISASTAAPVAADWSSNLTQLSGGQRSLVSLAFVLAATNAGVAPSLMLVDEVDAALDDVNQTRVGDMLAQCSSAHGCQVLAVSHSAALHGWCDTFVKVRCGAGGTEAAVATGGGHAGGSTTGLGGPGRNGSRAQTSSQGRAKVLKVAL